MRGKGNWFWRDGKWCEHRANRQIEIPNCVYEVIRFRNGKAMFWADHRQRLVESLEALYPNTQLPQHTEQIFEELLRCNQQSNINVLMAYCKEKWMLSLLRSSYPTAEDYQLGVKATIVDATRHNPQIKQYDNSLRDRIDSVLQSGNYYEALLSNEHKQLTEGSRSNLFFVKGNTIFTAPHEMVLGGITRNHLLRVIEQLGYSVNYTCVQVKNIAEYDAAFITGTSPLVLPLATIDHTKYNWQSSIVPQIMTAFEQHCVLVP